MTPSTFRKTLLAIAVTGATFSAHAGLAINGKTAGYENGIAHDYRDFSGTTTITGLFTSTDPERDGIEFEGVHFDGDLILNATVDVLDDAFELSGYEPEEGSDESYRASKVDGSVVNKGSLSVKGDVNAMMIDVASISGNLINEGSLKATAGGIGLDVWESTIDGEIKNAGSINAEGQNAVGISVSGDNAGSTVGENLLNRGTITVNGDEARGIAIENGTFGKSIENLGTNSKIQVTGANSKGIELIDVMINDSVINEGLISASGNNSIALDLAGTTDIGSYQILNDEGATISATGTSASAVRLLNLDWFGGYLANDGLITATGESVSAVDLHGGYVFHVENDGQIVATGQDSHGISIEGTRFDGYNGAAGHPNVNHILNSGLIQADGAAILIKSFEIDNQIDFTSDTTDVTSFGIENLGHIASKTVAIDASLASGNVDLHWGITDPNDEDIEEVLTETEVSTITGNLVDLNNIEIRQNARFTGAGASGANIVMKNNGWVNVGSTSDKLAGHLELGLPHTTIDGNLYVAGNSTLGLNLSAATDPAKAILSVTETAEFAQGSTLSLNAKVDDLQNGTAEYTLVEAGKLVNEGVLLKSGNPLLKLGELAATNTQFTTAVSVGNNAGEEGQTPGEDSQTPSEGGTAKTLRLTDTGIRSQAESFNESLEIAGSFTGTGEAVVLNSTRVTGDLLLNATVKVEGTEATGIDLLVDGWENWARTPVITGDLIQRGDIQATGDGSLALIIDPAEIGGSLVNEGTLSVKGGQWLEEDGEYDNSRALHVMLTNIDGDLVNSSTGKILSEGAHSAALSIGEDTTIGGKLSNAGLISASGENVTALKFSGPSEIDQNLENTASGKILAKGTNAKGILIEGSDVDGKLINRGLIEVDGANSEAIDITSYEYMSGDYHVSQLAWVGSIENHGTISATGKDANGIQIDGAIIDSIVNSATIQADGTAIAIDQFDKTFEGPEKWLEIEHQGGLISGGVAAIDGRNSQGQANNIDLMWSGGAIRGDILGLTYVGVRGSVEFDGARIEANEKVEVGRNDSERVIAAKLELAQPHTTIAGNLYVAGNSTLGLNLSAATNPEKAILSVTETAEFAQGSTLLLNAKAGDLKGGSAEYRLVEAGKLVDGGVQIKSGNPLLTLGESTFTDTLLTTAVSVDNSKAEEEPQAPGEVGQTPDKEQKIVFEQKSAEAIRDTFVQTASTGNSKAAGAALAHVVTTLWAKKDDTNATPAEKAAAEKVLGLVQTYGDLDRVMQEIVPETSGGATQAAVTGQSIVAGVAAGRTSGARGMSSGDSFQQTGVWLQALNSDATQDLRDGVAGFDATSNGIAVGADGKLNDQLTLGLAYSYLTTDVDSDGLDNAKTEVTGHAFTLYGGFVNGNYFVDGSLSYGLNDNEGKRTIGGELAKSDYDSTMLGVNVTAGYSYALQGSVILEPQLTARYSNVEIDGYTERGALLGSQIGDQRSEIGEIGAGVRLAGSLPMGQGSLLPQIKLMAYHDLISDQSQSTSTLVLGGTPFVTTGAKPERNSYEIGVGADYRLGALTLGVGYDYFGKTDYSSDTFTAKVRYDF